MVENKHVRKTYKDLLSNIKCTELNTNMFKSTAGTLTTLTAVITIPKTNFLAKKNQIGQACFFAAEALNT